MTHALAGKKQSAEHIEKRIAARRRNGTYWHSEASKQKMSETRRGTKRSESARKKISEWMRANHPMKGKKHTKEARLKMSASRKGVARPYLRGENASAWKGGKTEKSIALRRSLAYREWRDAVYKRDDYTCQSCGDKGGKLNPDHVMPMNTYPEMMFDVLNGRTLCHSCHRETDTYGWKSKYFEPEMSYLISNFS